ncbi:hypothetical protein Vadar_032951 [Vaccinium darrowii]|uniref:Uncharacterized protein n=1 Tax=Vaccinium darrowii TaxID=229202 RepID=A0ACB7X639_9ERIC|nr:hypothetical protein Vadar_032951 [Vaccinium darrowii]
MSKPTTCGPLGISLWQQPNPLQLVVKFTLPQHDGKHPPMASCIRSPQDREVVAADGRDLIRRARNQDLEGIVAYVRLWMVGTIVTGHHEPRVDGAVQPYAERVRDCYVSAIGLAAVVLGDEEAGVGYSGDVGGYVCCWCGLCYS